MQVAPPFLAIASLEQRHGRCIHPASLRGACCASLAIELTHAVGVVPVAQEDSLGRGHSDPGIASQEVDQVLPASPVVLVLVSREFGRTRFEDGRRPPARPRRADLDGENGVPCSRPQQASPSTDLLCAFRRPARSADRHGATRGGPPRLKKSAPSPARRWTVTAQACAAREINRLLHAVGHAGPEALRQQPPGLRIGAQGQRGESAAAA